MAKRRITKASKRRLGFFGPLCIIAIAYFIFSLLYNVYTIYTLSSKKQDLQHSYAELQEKAEDLKIDIQKLNDPEYLANYAREHYLYSKDGEYIIQMSGDAKKTTENINDISSQINKNYAILGLSIFMLFMFVYILKKGHRKSKK